MASLACKDLAVVSAAMLKQVVVPAVELVSAVDQICVHPANVSVATSGAE